MKESLAPLGSRSQTAAYLNQCELDSLGDIGEVAQQILAVVSKPVLSKLPSPLSILSDQLLQWSLHSEKVNVEAFAYCVAADIKRIDKSIGELFVSVRDLKILEEGVRRARSAASRDKILRLAQVVVSGINTPDDSEEKIMEFLRFASDLNETDIYVLNEIYSRQHTFDSSPIANWAQDIHGAMHEKPILDQNGNVMDDQYVRSAGARLQALGLVVQLGPAGFDRAPGDDDFALLRLGKEFVDYLKALSTTESSQV